MPATTENTKDIELPVGFETDPAEDALAREALTTARVALLLKASFFGNMATRLPLVNADEWLPTAATDGRYFYYNSKFILMLKPKEIEFLFGHETLHNVYDHLGRSKFNLHNPTIANIAADYAVNRDLVNSKIGVMITTVPALYDRKYEKLSMEEIYDDIYENAERINIDELADMLLDEHLDSDDGEGSEGDYLKQVSRVLLKATIVLCVQAARAGVVTLCCLVWFLKILLKPLLQWTCRVVLATTWVVTCYQKLKASWSSSRTLKLNYGALILKFITMLSLTTPTLMTF